MIHCGRVQCHPGEKLGEGICISFTTACESNYFKNEGGREGGTEQGRKEGEQESQARGLSFLLPGGEALWAWGWYLQCCRVYARKRRRPLGVADGCPLGPGWLLLVI